MDESNTVKNHDAEAKRPPFQAAWEFLARDNYGLTVTYTV
jgi:hypothetical protein